MVKKKVSKKKVSYNNKKIVLGVIVLVILFVLAFAYQGSREDEEGLGQIFDTGDEKRNDESGLEDIGDAEKKAAEGDKKAAEGEEKSNVCCYIQCHNKKMPLYNFTVFNLEKEECNKRSIEQSYEQSNNSDIVSFLDSCRTITKKEKKKKLRRKDWDVIIDGEIDKGGICEDKKVDNQCKGREIITASSKITGGSLQPPVRPLLPRGSRYPKMNNTCKKSDKDTNSTAKKAFFNAIKIDCLAKAKKKSKLECKEGCIDILSLDFLDNKYFEIVYPNIISLDWRVVNSTTDSVWGKYNECFTDISEEECCIWINECLVINECIEENRESSPDTPEDTTEDPLGM